MINNKLDLLNEKISILDTYCEHCYVFDVNDLYEEVDRGLFELFCICQWEEIAYKKECHDDKIIIFSLAKKLAYIGNKFSFKSRFYSKKDYGFYRGFNEIYIASYPHVNFNNIEINEIDNYFFSILSINPICGFYQLFNHFGWGMNLSCMHVDIIKNNSDEMSSTCIIGYQKDIKILWNKHEKYQDVLTICHEIGHVIHYRLAMEEQSFYLFEPTEIIREIFAFFFEGIALYYLYNISRNDVKDGLLSIYRNQCYSYVESCDFYGYPNCHYEAKVLSKYLISGYIKNRLSKEDIWSLMKMGGCLTENILMDFLEEKGCASERK